MKYLSVKAQLFSSFIIMALIPIVVGVIAIHEIRKISVGSEYITQSFATRSEIIEQLKLYVNGLDNQFPSLIAQKEQNTTKVDTYEEFKEVLKTKGGFVLAHWDGTSETEEKIKAETKATIRCLPLDYEEEEGVCIYSGKPSKRRVLFALAY